MDPSAATPSTPLRSTSFSTMDNTTDPDYVYYEQEEEVYELLPLYIIVPVVIIATIVVFVAVAGNLLVLVSYIMDPKLRTVSNLYVLNLAIVDLFLGAVSMPFYLVSTCMQFYWPFGKGFCKMYLVNDYTLCCNSVILVILISLDQLLILRKGVSYSTSETRIKVYAKLACGWMFAILLYSPAIISWELFRGYSVIDPGECKVEFFYSEIYQFFSVSVEFGVGSIALISLNLGVYWEIRKRTRVSVSSAFSATEKGKGRASNHEDNSKLKEVKKSNGREENSKPEGANMRDSVRVHITEVAAAPDSAPIVNDRMIIEVVTALYFTSDINGALTEEANAITTNNETVSIENAGDEKSNLKDSQITDLATLTNSTCVISGGTSLDETIKVSTCSNSTADIDERLTRETGEAAEEDGVEVMKVSDSTPPSTVISTTKSLVHENNNNSDRTNGENSSDATPKNIRDTKTREHVTHMTNEEKLTTKALLNANTKPRNFTAPNKVSFANHGDASDTSGSGTVQTSDTNNEDGRKKSPTYCMRMFNRRRIAPSITPSWGRPKYSIAVRRDMKAAKALFIFVFTFLVLWAPFSISAVIISICEDCMNWDAYEFFVWLLWFKSAVNPFLYAANNSRFKLNFIKILCKVCVCCGGRLMAWATRVQGGQSMA